jgi:hypothetical protein
MDLGAVKLLARRTAAARGIEGTRKAVFKDH